MDENNPPFLGTDAIARGLVTRRQLRADYQQVLPNVYSSCSLPLDPVHRAQAACVWARGRAVLAGRSAAAVWGVQGIAADAPAAIATPEHLRPPEGVEVYRATLADDERTRWLSLQLTTPARTAYDLGRHLPFADALAHIEQLYHRTGLSADDVWRLVNRYPRARGINNLRNVVFFSRQGVTTPFQSRTRAQMMNGRLPPAETMLEVRNERGYRVGVAHIGWRREQVAVQCFDDSSQREFDNLNTLVERGWRVFAVSAGQPVDHRPNPFFLLNHRIESALLLRQSQLG
ncbi:hypothetical protein [Tomitella biformata]|uniref:hypothetical protein n=1 Tax=Tomitella biformata TaxID=630403 RepID=UPI0004641159|nr:hypothetical protein [Tomitella biformata]